MENILLPLPHKLFGDGGDRTNDRYDVLLFRQVSKTKGHTMFNSKSVVMFSFFDQLNYNHFVIPSQILINLHMHVDI
jgi:hypothetical protein